MVRLKNENELDILRACADLVGRTLAEVARHIEPGVATRVLDEAAERFVRRHDAEPAFKGYRVQGLTPFPSTLCVSINDEVVHGIPGEYRLQEGDLVSVDCGVHMNGFFGDSAYTFVAGEPDPEDALLCAATHEALELGIRAIDAPNARIGDIGFAIQQHCEGLGYSVVHDLVGHGIGRKLHEAPQVPNFGNPGQGRRLRPGMTLCIEPMINRGMAEVDVDTDGWTVRTADREPSAHYEHMIAVGPHGPEMLTSFSYIEDIVRPPYRIESVTHG